MSVSRRLWLLPLLLFTAGLAFALLTSLSETPEEDVVSEYYESLPHAAYEGVRDDDGVRATVFTPGGGVLNLWGPREGASTNRYLLAETAVHAHAAVEEIPAGDIPLVRVFQRGSDVSVHLAFNYESARASRLGASVLHTLAAYDPSSQLLLPASLFPGQAETTGFLEFTAEDVEEPRFDAFYLVRRLHLGEGDDLLLLERRSTDEPLSDDAAARVHALLEEMLATTSRADEPGWPVPDGTSILSLDLDPGSATLAVEFNFPWWEGESTWSRAATDCLAATFGQIDVVEGLEIRAEGRGIFLPVIQEATNQIAPDTFVMNRPDELVMNAVGDVTLARGVREVMDEKGEDYPFVYAAEVFAQGDLTFANLEAPLSRLGDPLPGKGIWLRGYPESIPALHRAGIDVVNMANNHILDFGRPALLDTLDGLRQGGILPFGAGRDEQEAHLPLFWEGAGFRIAFLGYTEYADIFWDWNHPETFAAGPDLPGVAGLDPERMVREVRKIQGQADAVVVSIHWGPEYLPHPPPEHRHLALRLVEAGADVILGHHPHVLQSVEVHRDRPILYSLGNFIYDQTPLRRSETVIARLRWVLEDPAQVLPGRVEFVPFRIRDGQAVPAEGPEIDSIFDYLLEISAEKGTSLRREGELLLLDLPAGGRR